MTDRLYYTDSLLTSFDATVVAVERLDGRPAVVLDRTAFYPTSGGQPFDTGTLNGSRVLDVVDRDDDTIVHVVDEAPAVGAAVHGEVDRRRRLDHMQQHSGQHILSAAFDRLFRVRTVSFHLGAESSTIDLSREVTPDEIGRAVAEANRVVWEDRPVTVRFASDAEAAALPLRKESARTGMLRLVDVTEFDLSACGGTHVPRTGMIGVIAVGGFERFKGGSRVSFVCGGRALAAHDRLRDAVAAATRVLSVAPHELAGGIERLQADLRTRQRMVQQLQEEVAGHRAAALRDAATAIGGVRVVCAVQPGWDQQALKTLAAAVASAPGFVAVIAGEGEPLPVVVARSTDVAFDCGVWMKRAISDIGGRGGGRSDLAQGGLTGSSAAIFKHIQAALTGSL